MLVHVSTRSRNLGYGWTNEVEQSEPNRSGHRHLRVRQVTRPEVTGGLRTVQEERTRAGKLCSGGVSWREAYFVGGRKVCDNDSRCFLDMPLLTGKQGFKVSVED
jgi:hypothetical protein